MSKMSIRQAAALHKAQAVSARKRRGRGLSKKNKATRAAIGVGVAAAAVVATHQKRERLAAGVYAVHPPNWKRAMRAVKKRR